MNAELPAASDPHRPAGAPPPAPSEPPPLPAPPPVDWPHSPAGFPHPPAEPSVPPAQRQPSEAHDEARRYGVAVLLAAAAVLTAALGGRAALLTDAGTDTRHETLRVDVKRAAATVEDIRFLYAAEAPLALRVTEERLRVEALRARAEALPAGIERSALLVEAETARALADGLARTVPLTSDPRYRSDERGFDIPRRLADVRDENPDLVVLDPDAIEAEAEGLSRQGSQQVMATAPFALAFLLGAWTQAFPALRRPLLVLGFVFLALGLAVALALEVRF